MSERTKRENLRLKRRSLEAGQWEKLLGRGRGGLHIENFVPLHRLVDFGLRLTGLRGRGERNVLRSVVRRSVFAFADLPPAFDGLTLLHLSDIHADALAGLPEAIVERLTELEADLCVLTGDYRYQTYGPCDNVYPGMERILSAVNARLGVFGILGNHDFTEQTERLEAMGVRMLVNDARAIREGEDALWIVGVDDPHYYGCDDLDGALDEVPEDGFKILLAHSPELYGEAAAAGIALYLCGHTHAGQVRLPFLGAPTLNANCPRAYARGGAWRHKGMTGYTHAGTGASCVPVRFNCPAEIALIELRRE